jgi:superfamily I DNA/RNA helicase
MNNLNKNQKKALLINKGPLIIQAGPGTGKTKTLTAKIAYLVQQKNINLKNILALTFTRKAAKEMQDRLIQTLQKANQNFNFNQNLKNITTFHSFCYQILKQEIKNFDASKFLDPKTNLIDFDLLLEKTLAFFKTNLKIRRKYANQFKYILIDEFQDTSPIQYKIIKLLINQTKNKNFFIIGDPKQSIYAFRGAGKQNFKIFKTDFLNYQEVNLNINYRNSKPIIETSHQLFSNSKKLKIPKNKIKQKPNNIYLIQTLNPYSEADWIIAKINQLIGGTDLNQASDINQAKDFKNLNFNKSNESNLTNLNLSEIAVIYRTHFLAENLKKTFFKSGLPYQAIGDESIFLDQKVKKIINILEKIVNSNLKFKKKPKFLTYNLSEFIINIIQNLNLKKNQALLELEKIAINFENQSDLSEQIKDLLSYIQEIEKSDYYDTQAQKITLMTMHASKGLEFKAVFIIGFEETNLPYLKNNKLSPEKLKTQLKEEKNLLYVALTRAKEQVYLIKANKRHENQKLKISPFYNYLKTSRYLVKLKDENTAKIIKKIKSKRNKQRQTKLF